MSVSSAWKYKKKITITYAGAELTDYQLELTVNTSALISAGKMQADGGDIRFVDYDNTTNLPYYIDPYTGGGINSTTTTIFVKIPTIAATKDIYMYYGNADAANASSGADTFDLFDDFDDASFDTSIWAPISSSPTESGGAASIGASNAVQGFRSIATFGNNYITEGKVVVSGDFGDNGYMYYGLFDDSYNIPRADNGPTVNYKHAGFGGQSDWSINIQVGNGAGWENGGQIMSGAGSFPYTHTHFKIINKGASGVQFMSATTNHGTLTTYEPNAADLTLYFATSDATTSYGNTNIAVHWARVRKYSPDAISSAQGTEQRNVQGAHLLKLVR